MQPTRKKPRAADAGLFDERMNMEFQPDYRHFVDVMLNKRPVRLPLYEHIVNPSSMERILGLRFAELEGGDAKDRAEYFRHHCRFFREMTYDTVSYEVCIGGTLPGHTKKW
jgi:hypothetical protein